MSRALRTREGGFNLSMKRLPSVSPGTMSCTMKSSLNRACKRRTSKDVALMPESTHTYQVIIPYSIEEVWQALKHAADLDVAGGQEIVERVSDAEWTTALDERHSTRCTAAYDEAARRMDVTMDSTAKHENDTTSISLASVDAGTEVTVEQTVRGNFVVMKMLQLVGVGALDKVAGSIVSNIEALCSGGETRRMSTEDLEAYAKERVADWEKD